MRNIRVVCTLEQYQFPGRSTCCVDSIFELYNSVIGDFSAMVEKEKWTNATRANKAACVKQFIYISTIGDFLKFAHKKIQNWHCQFHDFPALDCPLKSTACWCSNRKKRKRHTYTVVSLLACWLDRRRTIKQSRGLKILFKKKRMKTFRVSYGIGMYAHLA